MKDLAEMYHRRYKVLSFCTTPKMFSPQDIVFVCMYPQQKSISKDRAFLPRPLHCNLALPNGYGIQRISVYLTKADGVRNASPDASGLIGALPGDQVKEIFNGAAMTTFLTKPLPSVLPSSALNLAFSRS